jgi:hypothetical protein
MSGNSKQDRQKSNRRIARKAQASPINAVELWEPPSDEPVREELYSIAISPVDRVVVRMTRRELTDEMVSFAVIQQTNQRTDWVNVAAVDTRHGTLHVHWYARTTGERTGATEHVKNLTSEAEVNGAYDLAYELILEKWEQNKARWHNA